MVKHDNKWGTVCDDRFGPTEAQAACQTLGFSGGSYNGNQRTRFLESSVPIWMDEVNCDSNSTNFMQCEHRGWGVENCYHTEDILLTCT